MNEEQCVNCKEKVNQNEVLRCCNLIFSDGGKYGLPPHDVIDEYELPIVCCIKCRDNYEWKCFICNNVFCDYINTTSDHGEGLEICGICGNGICSNCTSGQIDDDGFEICEKCEEIN
jgi:hypothetical protein